MIPIYLDPSINLEERIKEIDKLIAETKEDLKRYPEILYPREHEFYRQRLHSHELTRRMLIDALFEETIL